MTKQNTDIRLKRLRRKIHRQTRRHLPRYQTFGEIWRTNEVNFLAEGEMQKAAVFKLSDGIIYSVYITDEASIMRTEPFFVVYNDVWPEYATHALRFSMWEPKIVHCRKNPVHQELKLSEEMLDALVDVLHAENPEGFFGAWQKGITVWEAMILEHNFCQSNTHTNRRKKINISPQMIREKPGWYRNMVPNRVPMPEYHRLLYPHETFADYWNRRHGYKSCEEMKPELNCLIAEAEEAYKVWMNANWEMRELYGKAFLSATKGEETIPDTPCEFAVLEYRMWNPINFHMAEVANRHGIQGCRTCDMLNIHEENSCDYYYLLAVNDDNHPEFFNDVERFAATQKIKAAYLFPKNCVSPIIETYHGRRLQHCETRLSK